jgi:hypothetical protein
MQIPVGNPILIGLDHPLIALVGIVRRRKILTCTQTNTTRAKLEQLRSAILIRRDPKATKLDM